LLKVTTVSLLCLLMALCTIQ